MAKKSQEQQPARRAPISPLEVDAATLAGIAVGQTFIEVMNYDGADGYAVFERAELLPGVASMAYRTVQRIDLATRLKVVPEYDPADLVGRAFVVEA